MIESPMLIVGNPGKNNWCVLVETRNYDGTTSRFLSFHWSQEEALKVKIAHERDNQDKPSVAISMFKYDYVPSNEALLTRVMMEEFEKHGDACKGADR